MYSLEALSFYASAALYYLCWLSVPVKKFSCVRRIILLMLIICSCEVVSMCPPHYIAMLITHSCEEVCMHPPFYFTYVDKLTLLNKCSCALCIVSLVEQPSFVKLFYGRNKNISRKSSGLSWEWGPFCSQYIGIWEQSEQVFFFVV